ncbi:hypothetical protein CP8484711_1880B, partial [Chlamydia psittaci 84-8471/1]
YLLNLI